MIAGLLPTGLIFCMTGCAEMQMGYNVITYDNAVADTANQLLLLNAVRASQHYPMSFTAVGQVVANPPVSGSLGGTVNFSRPLGLTTYSVNPSISANAGYGQFALGNLNSQEFMLAIRKPIQQKITDSFYQNTYWPRVLLDLIYVQKLASPSESLIQSIDAERKFRCRNPASERDKNLCGALNRNIEGFASNCTAHFIDIRVRMSEFREDRNMYYNTAVNYCHFERFKILMEEMRLINRLPCLSKPVPECVLVTNRSALQMIEYLGELIAAQNYIDAPFIPTMLFGRSTEFGGFDYIDVPFFVVRRGGNGLEAAAVTVFHDESMYYIPQPDFGSPTEARSLQTLDLVLQTVQAATLRDDLPKVPTFGVITKQ
jgi:hypothetical protein